MNCKPLDQRLPAGLVDGGVEFYYHNGEIEALYGGKRLSLDELPEHVMQIVEDDMTKYPEAIKALLKWDLHTPGEMIRQYIMCRFGGFDNEADITADGKIEYTEYFDCGKRGQCSAEGKLCPVIQVGDEYLTKQETRIVRLTGAGKSNSEIAHELHITEDTVKSHMQNIQRKCGWSSKLDIVAFAVRKNLV